MGSIPSQAISKTLDMVPIGWVGGLDHKRISGLAPQWLMGQMWRRNFASSGMSELHVTIL